MFTSTDIGCYADGVFGHQHIRDRLADILVHMFRHSPRGGDGPYWATASKLVDELRGEMSDDAQEEYDALDMLNEYSVSWECYFEIGDGDLRLVPSEDYCEQFPDTPECGA